MPAPSPATAVGGRLTPIPWHPLLFAAWIVISAWLDAAVSPFAAVRALAVALVVAVVLTGFGWAVSRSAAIGGLIGTAILIAIWGRLPMEALSGILGRMGPLIGVVWLVLLLTLAAVLVLRTRRRWSLRLLTVVLNRASGLLLIATLVLGVADGRIGALVPDLDQGGDLASLSRDEPSGTRALPDMYVILLDGYPRADVLDFAFGIDNQPFLDALTDRGFAVARESHSDYLWTHVSVPSALNMAFVEDIPGMRPVLDGTAPRQPTLRRAFADNAAFEVARQAGYTTVAVASGFEEVTARQADIYVDGGQLNEFEVSLLTQTFAADALRPIWTDFGSSQQRDRIRGNLRALPDIAAHSQDAALFVFDHVPAPHQPTVFGPAGSAVVNPLSEDWYADSPIERGEDQAEFRERYRGQLPYLNQLVLEAIDGILAASDTPPVIVLFADHGSASAVDWNVTQPADADPARLLERTGILFAALTPDAPDLYPDDISPVDLYRLLFDAYLGTDYGRATPPADGGQVPPVDAPVLGP